MSELMPCPFCGGEAYFEDDGVIQETLYWVNCKCGIGTTSCHSKESLAKTWNHRTPDPRLEVAVEALEIIAKLGRGSGQDADLAQEALTRIQEAQNEH